MSSMTNYTVHQIEDKQTWESFVAFRPEANFLQSWNWSLFHQNLGKKTWQFGVFDQANQQVAGVSAIKEPAKRGSYLALYGGPLLDDPQHNPEAQAQLAALIERLKQLAAEEECLFIRLRPQLLATEPVQQLFSSVGFQPAQMHLTADLTLQLDLTKSPDELLAEMRKNTRYEVRKADKLGIEVTQSQDPAEIEEFNRYQLYLAEKHGFVPFSYQFLLEQFKAFAADDQVKLFHARLNGQLLASAFVIIYNREAVYHYGVSTPENDHQPGSYACQWAAIQEAQARGCTRYNFWGIAPKEQQDHRFAGVSLFKRGFGGEEVAYLPAQDLAVNWKYNLTRGFEFLRKKSRKL